jgi:nitroreductase
MNVGDAIRAKRAIRRFTPRPLDDAHLEQILDAGRRAGSSKNQQRWAFVVVRDAGSGRPPRAVVRTLAR